MSKENGIPADARPWKTTPIGHHTQLALKAVADGTADSGQQKLFMRWLVHRLCGTYEPTYFHDSVRDSDFASGRRYVGLQLIHWANSPVVAEDPAAKKMKDPHDAERQ